jgi:ABC-type sugar transport system ATPase subunit
MPAALLTTGLRKSYRGKEALAEVDLQIGAGEQPARL